MADLAIYARNLGIRSETFVRRQVQDLLPQRSVVFAVTATSPGSGAWNTTCPTLILDREFAKASQRAMRYAGSRVGWSAEEWIARRFLQRSGAKVMLGQYLDRALKWKGLAQRLGMRFFAHAHGYDVSRRLREPEWRTKYLQYNDADGVITMSQYSKARLVELGLRPEKIHVVPYGVDVPMERPPRPLTERAEVRCLAVGRMVVKKAPILLLEAFRRAQQRVQNLRLDYVGGGELYPAAVQYVRAMNLGDVVTQHGPQPSEVVNRLLGEADIFVQHSIEDPETGDQEGLPVAILEGMSRGLPIVSTRHAGIPEAVTEGVEGLLVDEWDIEGMADRVAALAVDPDRRARMSEAAWGRALQSFTWDRERNGLLDVLGLASSRREVGAQFQA